MQSSVSHRAFDASLFVMALISAPLSAQPGSSAAYGERLRRDCRASPWPETDGSLASHYQEGQGGRTQG